MRNLYNNLHKLYPLQKTLRFELKPIGKTKENIEKYGILNEDEHRAEIYKNVKKYCDEYHKKFIERALSNVTLTYLSEYQELYNIQKRDNKQNERLEKIQALLRKEIVSNLKKNKEEYDGLFSSKIIEEYLKNLYMEDKEKLKEIEEFKGFTTYFTGYNKNRENMYSDEEKSTAIAYRLINENLPKFLDNMKTYEKDIKNKIPKAINQIYKELEEYIQVDSLNEIFTLNYYNNVLTQKGIELYNIIISGKSEENKHIKGLNEYINEYNQNHSDKIYKLKELYKQILSDKIGNSFVLDKIENDKELIDSINEYYEEVNNILNNILTAFKKIKLCNLDKIYLNNYLSLIEVSNFTFDDWSYIKQALYNNYDKNYTGRAKKDKYDEIRKDYFKKMKNISLGYIENCIEEYDEENKGKLVEKLSNYLEEEKVINDIKQDNIINSIKKKYENCKEVLNKEYGENNKELIKDDKAIEKIKELLDEIKSLQEFVKIIIPKDKTLELDDEFYNSITEEYDILSKIIPLYNQVRNYLTQKPYSNEKIKINFQTSTFLDGWDFNKEKQNLGVILTKDNNYYLGILTKKNKNIFDEENITKNNNNIYCKMEYKLLPGPNKMLPKVFFSKSRIAEFNPSEELLKKYKIGLFKKGENFDLEFCHQLIDFYKESIEKHADWKNFGFKFKETNEYNDISEFYKEVEMQGYKINFANFSEDYINQKIEDGELYLFQIYNKDFSQYSHKDGKPNLHTMYWKALFDEDNLANPVYKLNGNAEMFYRKSSLELSKTTIHKANKPIENKNEYTKKDKPTSTFEYNLIKNKRYTVDKFQLNVPITINFKNQGISNINEIINKYLRYNDDIHIIGIDRGERNLLYVSVINAKGEIVYQKSLNEIENEKSKTDYHKLLDKREQEMQIAKKSWKTIGSIKELKEGYMSQVIYELVKLIQRYNNSIIVIEDLNKGFKNSRQKVEKQVYQKFEQMLINKLNYLVIKDKSKKEEGGILNAYQLTNEFQSFKKLGKQTGILFYIPAWCTSKIDPTTGFVNLFRRENFNKPKDFIKLVDDIRYNKEDYFEFDIDYAKFNITANGGKSKWTICTYSNRIKTYRDAKNNSNWTYEIIDLTKKLKDLLLENQIGLQNIKQNLLEKCDNKNNIELLKAVVEVFKLAVQMRNSITENAILLEEGQHKKVINLEENMKDYLISPIKNKNGKFFDSREGNDKLPKDADANGAYNIARKGLMLVKQIQQNDDDNLAKIKYDITNKEWLNFAQSEGEE